MNEISRLKVAGNKSRGNYYVTDDGFLLFWAEAIGQYVTVPDFNKDILNKGPVEVVITSDNKDLDGDQDFKTLQEYRRWYVDNRRDIKLVQFVTGPWMEFLKK